MDLISYDVLTPMAARGLFEAIHWTPSIRWRICSIVVLNEMRSLWSDLRTGDSLGVSPRATDARSCILVDVAYLVSAEPELTPFAGPRDTARQHVAMFRRRLRQGRLFRPAYLGLRSLAATLEPVETGASAQGYYACANTIDLGWMIHDKLPDRALGFFRATMTGGLIDVGRPAMMLAR